jgi:RNA polymerase sigma-70 factor (ECF subfamily)
LIRIYTKINSYEEKAQFKTWIQRIVTNICIDKFRKAKPTVSIEEHDLNFTAAKNVEDEVISGYLAKDIREAIDKLPAHHRTVVVLRYLQDFSYNEIADSLGLPLNTVKSYLFRARQQLQTLLREYQKGGVRG